MFSNTSMPDSDWWHDLWPNPDYVLHQLSVNYPSVAIDLCCGDGYFTVPLAKRCKECYGVELDYELVQIAKTAFEQNGIFNCSWIVADVMKLEVFQIPSADVILLLNTFHGIDEKEKFVLSVWSLLKIGGKFIVVNWHVREREDCIVLGKPRGPKIDVRISPQQTVDVVTKLGFEVERIVEIPPYHYGVVFVKV